MLSWRVPVLALRGAAGLLGGLAVLAAVAYAVLLLAGFKTAAVYSGSMEPSVDTGALVVGQPVAGASVAVGDVITFSNPTDPATLVTHRVVQVLRSSDGRLGHRTKGDANDHGDPWTLELPPTIVKVQWSVPYAGYALVYARTREVRTALVAVLALIVLTSLLRRIWRTERTPARRCAGAGR
jgi:signal peptidase I